MIGFVKSHVLDEHSSEVSEISSDMLKSPSGHACKLCRLKNLPNVVVVTCDMDIKSEETFLWTQQVSRLYVHCIFKNTPTLKQYMSKL